MIHREFNKGIGNWKNIIYSILPLNRWSNRMDKSRSESILMILHQLLTGQLDRIVSNYRIPI